MDKLSVLVITKMLHMSRHLVSIEIILKTGFNMLGIIWQLGKAYAYRLCLVQAILASRPPYL